MDYSQFPVSMDLIDCLTEVRARRKAYAQLQELCYLHTLQCPTPPWGPGYSSWQ